MQKPGKLFVGALTLWPLIYMVLFFIFIFSTILFPPEPTEGGFQPIFAMIFGLHLLTMLIIMGLTVFYMVDVFRNNRVDKDKKVLWAVVIFLGNMIAMPIYWYLYIWKEPAVAGQPLPGQLNSMNSSAWANNVSTPPQEQHQYVPPAQPPNWRE
jgi:hypothetical protein